MGITAGVIMDEDEGVGGVDDGGAQEFGDAGGAFVDAAQRDIFHVLKAQFGIEQDDPDDFSGFSAEVGGDEGGDFGPKSGKEV